MDFIIRQKRYEEGKDKKNKATNKGISYQIEGIGGLVMNKNEYVYCTNCKHFELLDNKTPFCINIDKCNISNPEDSLQYKDRPYYKPNYQLNKKAVYVSGILSHMREVDDMISAMEYGRVNYNHNLYAEKDALKFELNKIRRMDGELYIGEIEKE